MFYIFVRHNEKFKVIYFHFKDEMLLKDSTVCDEGMLTSL